MPEAYPEAHPEAYPEAYVDTSALAAIGFNEPGSPALRQRLNRFSRLRASLLLEAELRSIYARENLIFDQRLLEPITWIFPVRELSQEIAAVLQAGYLRGADLWHVAVALYSAGNPSEMAFVTLDARQRAVAATLGFQT